MEEQKTIFSLFYLQQCKISNKWHKENNAFPKCEHKIHKLHNHLEQKSVVVQAYLFILNDGTYLKEMKLLLNIWRCLKTLKNQFIAELLPLKLNISAIYNTNIKEGKSVIKKNLLIGK